MTTVQLALSHRWRVPAHVFAVMTSDEVQIVGTRLGSNDADRPAVVFVHGLMGWHAKPRFAVFAEHLTRVVHGLRVRHAGPRRVGRCVGLRRRRDPRHRRGRRARPSRGPRQGRHHRHVAGRDRGPQARRAPRRRRRGRRHLVARVLGLARGSGSARAAAARRAHRFSLRPSRAPRLGGPAPRAVGRARIPRGGRRARSRRPPSRSSTATTTTCSHPITRAGCTRPPGNPNASCWATGSVMPRTA